MATKVNIDWSKFLTIDSNWVKSHLTEHKIVDDNNKVVIRTYTVQFSGTQYETTAWVEFLADSIVSYVLDPIAIETFKKEGKEPYRKAMSFFGNNNPTYDGKYGELILYLLTEAVLRVPMVAHKLQTLSNPNDQVKGGDGIFYGEYKGVQSIFIGESKTWKDLGKAVDDAFKSLDRFHQNYNPASSIFEFNLARRNIRQDLSQEEIDVLYSSFNPGAEEYKKSNKVHPVLIIYDEKDIDKINAKDNLDAEDKIRALVAKKIVQNSKKVANQCSKYSTVSQVYLDLFFIPVSNVDALKHALYATINGGKKWVDIENIKKTKVKIVK